MFPSACVRVSVWIESTITTVIPPQPPFLFKQWKAVVETASVCGSRKAGVSVIYRTQAGTPLSFHVAWFPPLVMNTSFSYLFCFFFKTAAFTLSRSRRVICHGINGRVQLCGVKQVVKRRPHDTPPTRPELVRLLAWVSPACLPASLLSSNGTNYPATLSKTR